MAQFSFIEVIKTLEAMGLSDVLIPFLLIFAIMFAVLANINIFGAKRKNINLIVAMAIALLVVVPHLTGNYPPGYDIVEIISSAIPTLSVIVVAVMLMLILIGIFGIRLNFLKDESRAIGAIITLVSAGIVIVVFGDSAGWFTYNLPPALQFLKDPNLIAVVVVLLVFGLIVMFITDDGTGRGLKGYLGDLGKAIDKVG